MRLINAYTLELEEFIGHHIPRYAILSHTWEEEEVTYEDYIAGKHKRMKGYDKVRMACMLAVQDGLPYAWADTCCIDKRSSAELTEAINSMFLWYQKSAVCYAYLSDMPTNASLESNLRDCRWFTRGWTLQELIAPQHVRFYDSAWYPIGTKKSLAHHLWRITRISYSLLIGQESLSVFSVAQRMSWAATRQTTRTEDIAYCLFGIFDLNLPLLYGEGKKAFRRLQLEIIRTNLDMSIFAWQLLPLDHDDAPMTEDDYNYIFKGPTGDRVLSGVLAASPAEFYPCTEVISDPDAIVGEVSSSSLGIVTKTRLLLCRTLDKQEVGYVLPLSCTSGGWQLGIHVRQVGHQQYLRTDPRLLLRYNRNAILTGDLIIVGPEQRHLLLGLPTRSGYQDFRLGHASRIVPRLRKKALQICKPQGTDLIEPWPLRYYDHQDCLFAVPAASRSWFACVKFLGVTSLRNSDEVIDVVAFGGWLCVIGWSVPGAQFTIFENSDENDEAIRNLLAAISDNDYHTGQIRSLLESYKIPIRDRALCRLVSTSTYAVVTASMRSLRSPDVCADSLDQIHLDHEIKQGHDLPNVQSGLSWFV